MENLVDLFLLVSFFIYALSTVLKHKLAWWCYGMLYAYLNVKRGNEFKDFSFSTNKGWFNTKKELLPYSKFFQQENFGYEMKSEFK